MARKYSPEFLDMLRQMTMDGMSRNQISERLGINRQTLAKIRQNHKVPVGLLFNERRAKANEYLRAHYVTHPDAQEMLAEYNRLLGRDSSMKAMQFQAQTMGLSRKSLAQERNRQKGTAAMKARKDRERAQNVERLRAYMQEHNVSAHAASSRCGVGKTALKNILKRGLLPRHYERRITHDEAQALGARIAARVAEGTHPEIAARAEGATAWMRGRLRRLGLLPPYSPPPKQAGTTKPPKEPKETKPPKIKALPKSWVRVEAPQPPRPVYQTVEAFLAAGGRITQCPAAAVHATTATLGEGREIIRQHAAFMAGDDGNWLLRAKKKMGRFHFGAQAQ